MNFYYLQLHVIYKFSCSACKAGYNRKTDQNFNLRIKEDRGLDIFKHVIEFNVY